MKEGSPEQAALHAIVAAAGTAVSGQDVLSGSAGAAASSLLTNLLDTPGKTEEEKEANRNLLLTLVAGISEGMGTDTATATNSAAAALDNNYFPGGGRFDLLDQPQTLFKIKPGNRGDGSVQSTLDEWKQQSKLDGTTKATLIESLAGILGDLQSKDIDLRSLTIKDLDNLVSGKTTGHLSERYNNWLTGGGFNLDADADKKRVVLNFVGGTKQAFWRNGSENTLDTSNLKGRSDCIYSYNKFGELISFQDNNGIVIDTVMLDVLGAGAVVKTFGKMAITKIAAKMATREAAEELALKGARAGAGSTITENLATTATRKALSQAEKTAAAEAEFNDMFANLIKDSNKKLPLSNATARSLLSDYAPDGFVSKIVKGPGGAGADILFEGPGGQVFKIEAKSTTSFGAFNKELSYAAQKQAGGNLVAVQVEEGTDVSNWLSKFWGNRKELTTVQTVENMNKLNVYKNTEIIILDTKGQILLPRQPIYNPPKGAKLP